MVKILERSEWASSMMDSSDGGQEELPPVAGLRDRFHQSKAALAELVNLGDEEVHKTVKFMRRPIVSR